jgi:hypothetical protein
VLPTIVPLFERGAREALSKISKSHIVLESWNQFHFNCPIASVVGTMRAADATFPKTFARVRSSAEDGAYSGASLSCT